MDKAWWDGLTKTEISALGLSRCAAQNQRSAYKTAFAYDEVTKTCQMMDQPAGSTFGPSRSDPNAADFAPVYFTGERGGPGVYFYAKETGYFEVIDCFAP